MNFWDFKRSSASVRLMVEFGQERGLDAAKILARSGLKEADLADLSIELDASQELCVVGNLIRACRQPGLGLEVGMRYNFASYGLWGLGLISSATAGDALALALRFIPLTFAFCRISGALDGDMFTVTFEAPDVEPAVQRFLVERDVVAAARLMKEVLGPEFVLSRFTFQHAAERGAGRVEDLVRVVGVRPEFGASSNSLTSDSKLLALRRGQIDPGPLHILDPLRRPCPTPRPCVAVRMIFKFGARRFAFLIPISTGDFAHFSGAFRKYIVELQTKFLKLFFNLVTFCNIPGVELAVVNVVSFGRNAVKFTGIWSRHLVGHGN